MSIQVPLEQWIYQEDLDQPTAVNEKSNEMKGFVQRRHKLLFLAKATFCFGKTRLW